MSTLALTVEIFLGLFDINIGVNAVLRLAKLHDIIDILSRNEARIVQSHVVKCRVKEDFAFLWEFAIFHPSEN